MKVFKPDVKNIKSTDCLENLQDDFYKHSHGLSVDQEFTVCGMACEEWDYNKTLSRKRITCPECLRIIRHCKKYKL